MLLCVCARFFVVCLQVTRFALHILNMVLKEANMYMQQDYSANNSNGKSQDSVKVSFRRFFSVYLPITNVYQKRLFEMLKPH